MIDNADSKQFNDTETKILHAAELEFMTKGFAGARTTSIAEEAGVTHAMLHYYFRTKEKLFDRIISEKMGLLKKIVVKSFEDMNMPFEDMIRNLINLHLDFIYANRDLPRFLIGEVINNPERLSSFLRNITNVAPNVIIRLQMKIDEMAVQGKCRKVDARMLMLDIVSLNVFPYIASPMINLVLDDCMADASRFLELRKNENFETIMRKLRP